MTGPHVQSLVYCMVARGDAMLSHYSAFPSASASFSALAAACLPKLAAPPSSSSSSKGVVSYTCDDYTFHFLVEAGFTYLVISKSAEGDKIASACLERIKEDFHKRYGDVATDVERFKARSLDKDFGPRLKEHMQYCLDNYQKLRKLASMKEQTLEVKETISENIDKVLQSGESVHLRVESIDVLHAHAENFHRQGQQLKRKMRRRQIKLRLLVLLVSIIIILCTWLFICKGFDC